MTFYVGGCLAGHGDDEYTHATSEWIKEFEENGGKSLDSAEKCDKLEVEERQFMVVNFVEPMQFNEGDALTVWYAGEDADDRPILRIHIERA
jgi:hypothetical protein